MLSLGDPKPIWSYSRKRTPFIPTRRPPREPQPMRLSHRSDVRATCSDVRAIRSTVRAIRSSRIVANLERFAHPKIWSIEWICVTVSPLFLCYAMGHEPTSNPRSDSLMIYPNYPPIYAFHSIFEYITEIPIVQYPISKSFVQFNPIKPDHYPPFPWSVPFYNSQQYSVSNDTIDDKQW